LTPTPAKLVEQAPIFSLLLGSPSSWLPPRLSIRAGAATRATAGAQGRGHGIGPSLASPGGGGFGPVCFCGSQSRENASRTRLQAHFLESRVPSSFLPTAQRGRLPVARPSQNVRRDYSAYPAQTPSRTRETRFQTGPMIVWKSKPF